MEYLDTGDRDPAQTLHAWLARQLPGASWFGTQTGYFTADALYAFETEIQAILHGGGEVRLVLGANEDELSAADLNDALDLLEPFGARASIVIVSAVDVLMHPKTFYVEDHTGRAAALVGSANLTGSGLGGNIEAALAIDSTSDPGAPFAPVKAAIEAWRTPLHPNAKLLDRAMIPKLAAAAVIDRPRRARTLPKRSLRRLFPPLGRMVKIPRRAKRRRPPSKRATAILQIAGGGAFPPGTVGIVKKLSTLDTKGFRGKGGTLYVSMPPDLLPLLPTAPFGKNSEPRVEVTLEARLAAVPGPTIASGANPTNITGVGYGAKGSSNRDVRLNILRVTVSGIEYIATNAAVRVPAAGDFMAVEFDSGGHAARLTFVTDGKLKTDLAAACGGRAWAWLPSGTLPTW